MLFVQNSATILQKTKRKLDVLHLKQMCTPQYHQKLILYQYILENLEEEDSDLLDHSSVVFFCLS